MFFCKKKRGYILLIIGNYASSTTLWFQILSTIFKVNYINNVSAKFFKCILIGQLINKVLYFLDIKLKSRFISEDGTTKGFLEPNEFGWYWRKFFTKYPTKSNIYEFKKNINIFSTFSNIPFLFKYSMTPNINSLKKNYKYFRSIKNDLIIIYPYRKKKLVINSILNRRKKLKKFSSTYKFKIKGTLRNSVKKQVQEIYNEHNNFLSFFDRKRILFLNFEKFKKNKKKEINKIINFLANFDIEMNESSYIKDNLKNIKFKKDIKKIKI